MERLWTGVERLARIAIWCGGILLFVAALIVTAEVAVRKMLPEILEEVAWLMSLAGHSNAALEKAWKDKLHGLMFSGSDELSGYLFAVGTSWSMAHVLVTRGHVRIDALYGNFSPRVRAWLDLAALLAMALFVGALVDRAFALSWTSLIENIRSNTNLRVPLAWAQLPWFAGIALFFAAIVLAILRTLAALMRGDIAAVQAIAGATTQDEEIEGELKGLGLDTAGASHASGSATTAKKEH